MTFIRKHITSAMLSAALLCAACGDDGDRGTTDGENSDGGDGPIKLGLVVPALEYKTWAQTMVNAAKLAASEINAAGGVLGRDLEIVVGDDQGDAERAVTVSNLLIEQEGVVAIIGPTSSERALRVANEVTIPAGIPLVSQAATADEISDLDDQGLVCRTVPRNSLQASAAAAFIKDDRKVARASVIYVNDEFGKNLATQFEAAFRAQGGTFVRAVAYPAMDDYAGFDFKASVDALFESEPGAIYFITRPQDGALIMTTMFNEGHLSTKPLFVGTDGNIDSSFIDDAPPGAVDSMYFVTAGTSDKAAGYALYRKNFGAKYEIPEEIDFEYSDNTYDAVYLLAYAIAEAKSSAGAEIARAIVSASREGAVIGVNEYAKGLEQVAAGDDIDYDGASGRIELDDAGDITSGSFAVSQVRSGKIERVKIVEFSAE